MDPVKHGPFVMELQLLTRKYRIGHHRHSCHHQLCSTNQVLYVPLPTRLKYHRPIIPMRSTKHTAHRNRYKNNFSQRHIHDQSQKHLEKVPKTPRGGGQQQYIHRVSQPHIKKVVHHYNVHGINGSYYLPAPKPALSLTRHAS